MFPVSHPKEIPTHYGLLGVPKADLSLRKRLLCVMFPRRTNIEPILAGPGGALDAQMRPNVWVQVVERGSLCSWLQRLECTEPEKLACVFRNPLGWFTRGALNGLCRLLHSTFRWSV